MSLTWLRMSLFFSSIIYWTNLFCKVEMISDVTDLIKNVIVFSSIINRKNLIWKFEIIKDVIIVFSSIIFEFRAIFVKLKCFLMSLTWLRMSLVFSSIIYRKNLIWKVELISDFSLKSFPQWRMPNVVQAGNGPGHQKWIYKM
jgi:hypothetical protein